MRVAGTIADNLEIGREEYDNSSCRRRTEKLWRSCGHARKSAYRTEREMTASGDDKNHNDYRQAVRRLRGPGDTRYQDSRHGQGTSTFICFTIRHGRRDVPAERFVVGTRGHVTMCLPSRFSSRSVDVGTRNFDSCHGWLLNIPTPSNYGLRPCYR